MRKGSDEERAARRVSPAEATEHPWWVIIDPRQMMRVDVHTVASMVTGPWLSRDAAQAHLDGRRYAFSDRAKVYCMGGTWSWDWRALCEEKAP